MTSFVLEGPGGIPGLKQIPPGGSVTTGINWIFGGNVTILGTLAAASESITSEIITTANANAFAVGPAVITNPTFNVDTSTASAVTGLNIKSAAAGSGFAISVLSSGTNEGLKLNAKGSGTIVIGNVSTGSTFFGGSGTAAAITNSGSVIAGNNLAITAGGSNVGFKISTTSTFGIYAGSGVPTISAAQGSIYLRSDGSSVSTRLYVNTDGGTTWTNVTTAA